MIEVFKKGFARAISEAPRGWQFTNLRAGADSGGGSNMDDSVKPAIARDSPRLIRVML